jgi:ABC-2 type transport system permease protein
MIFANVVRRLAARHLVFLTVATGVLAGFQLIIPAVISTLNLSELIGGVLAMLPPAAGMALGEKFFGGLTTTGLLGFGWNHPITHATGTAVAVVLGARAIAGEVENGTLELVLAQPIGRTTYLAANIAFALGGLALLCGAGLAATVAGTRMFGVAAPPFPALVAVAANLFLLLAAIHAATLFASSFGREGGHALGIGFLVAVASFLIHTVAALWPAAAFLSPLALHSYFVPRDVLAAGQLTPVPVAVLGGWTLLCLGGAWRRFATRDVP